MRLRSTSSTRALARAAASAAYMPAAPVPMTRLSVLQLCVLARELRRGALQPLLLALEPGFARPGALQLVFHADDEPAQPVHFQLDPIAVLERREAAMVGAGGQDVARLEV